VTASMGTCLSIHFLSSGKRIGFHWDTFILLAIWFGGAAG
jgi:hypothetical protein